ncbi:TIGR03086 family metal-binding protein [Actinoplanes sp. NPDC049681]|uniref:TIGR03086 family metal-binding protein n=1 Tax=Actinoplanes sp. NPDC049681 TaxID=3363905 RepID=UPI0037BD7B7C
MRAYDLLTPALEPTLAVVRHIRPEQVEAPTPCADFTVRTLLAHLREWAPILAAASPAPPPSSPEPGRETGLEAGLTRLAAAWSSPAAWQGTATMSGGPEMPAAMVGGMVLGEIVIHGWDLARATGQEPRWEDEVLSFLHDEVARTADLGREVKAYGPEVPVPPTASPLDRILGLTGRDPGWSVPGNAER